MQMLAQRLPEGTLFDWDALHAASPAITPIRRYFRYEADGFEHVPDGPHLLVANHNGGKLPLDMFMFGDAWHRHFGFRRPLFTLMHDLLFRLQWMGNALGRIGGMPASRGNAAKVFDAGQPLLVLPGGDHETFRPFSERHRIDFNNRFGFVREAVRHRIPVVPVVTIGSHEIFFILSRGEAIAKLLRLKKWARATTFPLIVGFPLGFYFGPLPSPFPLPSKVKANVLKPIELWRREDDHPAFDRESATDDHAMRQAAKVVTLRMQAALTEMAKQRRFPVLG